jgi:hypothetical protein
LLLIALFGGGSLAAQAQRVVNLPRMVLVAQHTEYVSTQNPNTPRIIDVKTSNPGVATALVYRVSQVQITAVAQGRTDVEFFDAAQRILYRVTVWVEDPNATGGGGSGYDRTKTQLAQIVMLVQHTQNVTVPGAGRHQLSSVKSSNKTVATARTDTANSIQIYSKTSGDAFVEFTDNATGTTYQVHVWVVHDLKDPIGPGAGGGHNPEPATPNPKPKPSPKPAPNPGPSPAPNPIGGGAIDPCLLGGWVATNITSLGQFRTTGGAGFHVTFKQDGTETIDYSAMETIAFPDSTPANPDTWTYGGTASARISTKNKVAKIESSGPTAVTRHAVSVGQNLDMKIIGLGPGGLGTTANDNGYACTENSLEYKTSVSVGARRGHPDYSVELRRRKN